VGVAPSMLAAAVTPPFFLARPAQVAQQGRDVVAAVSERLKSTEAELTASLRGQTAALQELAALRGGHKKVQAQMQGLAKLCRALQAELKEARSAVGGGGGRAEAGGSPADPPPPADAPPPGLRDDSGGSSGDAPTVT